MSFRRNFRKSRGYKRGGSTNYVTATYQEIYDVNTSTDEISIIGIHTPTGSKPRALLDGFFKQYRKFSYLGCNAIGTFAAGLPVDIMALNPESGQANVDPRDVLNPILSRGCHGDNISAALNSIYNGAFVNEGSSLGMDTHLGATKPAGDVTWEQMYYRMLQDPSFRKYRMGTGFKLTGLHPMVYNVASNHQIVPTDNVPTIGQLAGGVAAGDPVAFASTLRGQVADGAGSSALVYPQFVTNRLTRLGWMDTRAVLNGYWSPSTTPGNSVMPRLFMAMLVLPKAYRCSNAMRIVLSHKFAFREFNTSLTLDGADEYYDWFTDIVPDGESKQEKEKPGLLRVDNDTLEIIGGEAKIVADGVF